MLREERFNAITEYLREKRTAKFSEIAKLLSISEATARKDLAFMESKGVVRVVRGGAVWKDDDLTRHISEVRDIINKEEKQLLVEKLGEIIIDGQAIALNGGTTTTEAARFIARNYDRLTVVTNNIFVIDILKEKPKFTLISPGGIYYEPENTIVGKRAEWGVAQYNTDVAILAVNAISLEKGITDFRMEECGIINTMIANSQKSVVIADHSKFERVACMNVCSFERIDHIITDPGIDPNLLTEYKSRYIDVLVSDAKGKNDMGKETE